MADPLAHIPGGRGLPVVGHTIGFVRDARTQMEDFRRRHGDVFKARILGQTEVILATPEAAKTIYLDLDRNFSSTEGWAFTIGPLFQRGLMLRDFDDHRIHRRIMAAAFRRDALAGYIGAIDRVILRHLPSLDAERVDVYRFTKRLTLDIASEVFVGVSLGAEVESVNRAFVDMMRASITPLRLGVPGSVWARGWRGRRHLEELFGRLIVQRRHQPEGTDMLGRLVHAVDDSGRGLTDDEIVDHMIFLLLAAHDTTTATVSVMLWELARHQDWQERVRAEVRELGGAAVDLDNEKHLSLTELVFKEALRLHPPVPFSPRGTLRDCEIDGWAIPAGAGVAVPSLLLHRHPDWWTDPDRFDPDRFSPGREEHRRHTHLYVPFGGGAHTCLGNHFAGLMTKAMLARVLTARRFAATPGQKVFISSVPIPKPRGGLPLLVS